MTTIGNRLKDVREEKGLTQRDVARAAGISQSTYSDLERGDSAGRSLEVLAQVAKGIGVSADYLLGIEQEVQSKGRGKLVLTPQERELLALVRDVRPKTRRTVLRIVRDLHEEEVNRREDLALLEQIEELDKHGLFEKAQSRLFALAAEHGSLREGFAALREETEAAIAALATPGEPTNAD